MDLLERLRQHAAFLPEVKLAVLFGSTARGEARKVKRRMDSAVVDCGTGRRSGRAPVSGVKKMTGLSGA